MHILIIEDNEGDLLLITEALEESKKNNTITIIKDGLDAINFLKKTGKYINERSPDLILLDINLPKMNGQEVLRSIKANDNLKGIPVIIFSTSSSERDIFESYNNHANCYITKPVDVVDFLKVIASIENFWTSIFQLPLNINK
jgi:chemotaxis family two-component system response regulator Rcp1